jgi:hypothetical protein
MKYKQTNVTSKNGINYLRSVVEATSCLFHKIEQENDLGIDCIIEFTKDEKPMHKSIAGQIKSGDSYYDSQNNQCKIPVDSHNEYWTKYPLPVYGFVFVPHLEKAYFVNIKSYLENNKEDKTIRFDCLRSNTIDLNSFERIFIPSILGDIPSLSFEEAASFFESLKPQESYLGAKVLFRRYKNNHLTWDKLINYLENTEIKIFNLNVIYFISHIPWHPDIFHYGEYQNEEIRNYAKEKIKNLNREVVLKLLRLIDLDEGIVRGSIGQSIEAILSNINKIEIYLTEIIDNRNIELKIKEVASAVLAYYQGVKSIKTIKNLAPESEITAGIIAFLKEYKSYDLYQ